jgi:3',5'-cyclic AMP phosphodiesterase CpdA
VNRQEPNLSRRQLLAAGIGVAGAAATGGGLHQAWGLLSREDLVPGVAPDLELQANRWESSADRLTFAAIGDNGSGGRQAMAVAEQLALSYRQVPFGLVSLLGDICYYGPIRRRFDDTFVKPMSPLIDAGVDFELAIGNHDGGVFYDDRALSEIEDTLELLGTPARFYASTRGPVDFFYLDSSQPAMLGPDGAIQLEWLDDTLAAATSQWRIVALHHPIYSSGTHGPTPRLDELLEPILRRHRVDLVLAGHDHHYERTVPIDGITYVVSGGGCKLTPVRPKPYSDVAVSALQFMHFDIAGDRLTGRSIGATGDVIDRFELRARERRR